MCCRRSRPSLAGFVRSGLGRARSISICCCTGVAIVQSEGLIVPHPRMHERLFVLAPLVEIAPLAVHPVLQSTAKDLLDRLKEPRESRRELAGQTAVVTGSTSGIGRAVALELADAGANVVIHGRRSRESAERVADECRARQVDARCIPRRRAG